MSTPLELARSTECEKLFNAFIDSKNNNDVFQISNMNLSNDPNSFIMICRYKNFSHPVDNFSKLQPELKKLKVKNNTYIYDDEVVKLNTYKMNFS